MRVRESEFYIGQSTPRRVREEYERSANEIRKNIVDVWKPTGQTDFDPSTKGVRDEYETSTREVENRTFLLANQFQVIPKEQAQATNTRGYQSQKPHLTSVDKFRTIFRRSFFLLK